MKDALESREKFYEFLSEVYSRGVPRKFIEDVRGGVFSIPQTKNMEIERGFKEACGYLSNAQGSTEELVREIEDEYVRLFLGPVEAEVMPYQSTYEGNAVYGETTLRLRKLFRRAGVRLAEGAGISEDHLGAELRFMAHLCRRTRDLRAQGADAAEALELQKEFLEENMLPWVEKFCGDVLKSRNANFYRGMARITMGFLEEDRAFLYELTARL